MNILITGVHGFVGSNIVQQLSKENTIYGLDIITPEKVGVSHTFLWSQMEIIPEVEAIIHLAGKVSDSKNKSETNVYFEVNTGLTQKIYDYFLKSSATKFIFFSSVKAVADIMTGNILTENIIPSPKGPYGESKIAAENYILSKSVNNKHVYILRPCMIHGKGNKGNLDLLFNIIKKGIPWPLGAFENNRSFTSIDNLNYVVESLLKLDVPTGIYNMADDEPLSTNELIKLISFALEKSVRIWRWNCSFVEICARIGTIFHLPLNSERLQKLTENYIVSNDKLKNALGIEKMPISARNGLIKTFDSFK